MDNVNDKKRSFEHISLIVKKYRKMKAQQLPQKVSQEELSKLLGYKNGQFISNVERGKCSIPLKSLAKLANILDIPVEELVEAVVKDFQETVYNHMRED